MRLKFSIRDCLLATAIVGLALGWWLDRGKRIEQHAETTLQLRQSLGQQTQLRSVVIHLAGAMRDDGWIVRIEPNGAGGYALAPIQNWEGREEVAFKFNREYPLPREEVAFTFIDRPLPVGN